jgi:hypothetical protein
MPQVHLHKLKICVNDIMPTQTVQNDRIASTRREKFKETNMAAKKTVNINTITTDLKNQM